MWILTLWANPLARKIVIGCAVSLAIFYALRLWSNRVYSEGFKTGKAAGLSEMESQKNEEWKAKADAIATQAARTATDRKALEAESAALIDARRGYEFALARSLKESDLRKEANYAQVASVADADLDAAIRAVSAELAVKSR
jgi:hypothetical protein